MTGRFETLIYTDCHRGQGLRGDPGLQFQAKSPGAGAADMDLVKQTLLYEVPAEWRRRPAEDYPPSLGHVCDPASQTLATAQGAYLGKEASGIRDGNQLTHAIVTADPRSYGFVRPAQLLNASFWTAEPAATTGCPPLDPGWQPGPYEPAAIQDFVAAQEDGRDLLGTLLTALYRVPQPGSDRIVFVADDTAQVIQWIAAATLLLPQQAALAVGFKVFTTSPAYCSQPVLAVHPDWAGPYRSVDSCAGFVVLDLTTRRHTALAPDSEAQQWADLFLAADVYDVMDAVELADTLVAAGAAAGQARAVAVAVALGRRPPAAEIPAAADWIATAPAGLVAEHGDSVVSVLLADARATALRVLDAAAAAGRIPAAARDVRVALLRSETDTAARTAAARDERLAALPRELLPDSARAAGAALLVAAIEAAPDESVDALLRVGWRHRLPLPVSALSNRMARFASWWAGHPEAPGDPSRWPCGAEVLDLVRDELARRLAGPEPAAGLTLAAVHEHWWQLLLETAADPNHALDAAIMAGAMYGAAPPDCLLLIRRVLDSTGTSPLATGWVAAACAALWRLRSPDPREALTALSAIPPRVPVDRELIRAVTTGLEEGWPDGDLTTVLDAAAALASRKAPVPDRWRDAHRDDQRLSSLCQALASSSGQSRELLRKLSAVDGEVVAARTAQLAAALARHPDPDLVLRIMAELPRRAGPLLLAELSRAFAREPASTAASEFGLLRSKHLPAPLGRRLEEDLRRQIAEGGTGLAESVRAVLNHAGSPLGPEWERWAAAALNSANPPGTPHRPAQVQG